MPSRRRDEYPCTEFDQNWHPSVLTDRSSNSRPYCQLLLPPSDPKIWAVSGPPDIVSLRVLQLELSVHACDFVRGNRTYWFGIWQAQIEKNCIRDFPQEVTSLVRHYGHARNDAREDMKYMKRSASESIRNALFEFGTPRPFFSPG